jgi:hypothetical protein
MTAKKFLNSISNGKTDIIQTLLEILAETSTTYCVIGGLGVNAYVEPVVSLDIDMVIAIKDLEKTRRAAESRGLKIELFEHSLNIGSLFSDIRIQFQTDPRYQDFIPRAEIKEVLGYKMNVASIEDVLQGKVWAYSDPGRRKSKRQKDLADILRILEKYPQLIKYLPLTLREKIEKEQ